MSDERQMHYERGIDILNQHHPVSDGNVWRATPPDIIVLLGREAARADALESEVERLREVEQLARTFAEHPIPSNYLALAATQPAATSDGGDK